MTRHIKTIKIKDVNRKYELIEYIPPHKFLWMYIPETWRVESPFNSKKCIDPEEAIKLAIHWVYMREDKNIYYKPKIVFELTGNGFMYNNEVTVPYNSDEELYKDYNRIVSEIESKKEFIEVDGFQCFCIFHESIS